MVYEYFISITTDTKSFGLCYKINYKLDSLDNMVKITEKMREEGYENPVIVFFKLLNEQCEE